MRNCTFAQLSFYHALNLDLDEHGHTRDERKEARGDQTEGCGDRIWAGGVGDGISLEERGMRSLPD